MKSIKNIYVIGNGPSSSHTMGPSFAVDYILKKYKDISFIEVILFGSLAFTGKGHLTDTIIDKKLNNINHKIVFDYKTKTSHPNTMIFNVYVNDEIFKEEIISIGGGSIQINGETVEEKDVYKEHYLIDVLDVCNKDNMSIYEYVIKNEGKEILAYLEKVYEHMLFTIKEGVKKDGYLPGSLKVKRKAKEMSERIDKSLFDDIDKKVTIAAFSVSEENASGEEVVTAPTCGSCGVVPGVITYLLSKNIKKEKIIEGLAVAGLIGEIVKTNASVSGAVGGCQAEIGVACSMGSALIMHAFGFPNTKIAQASEIA